MMVIKRFILLAVFLAGGIFTRTAPAQDSLCVNEVIEIENDLYTKRYSEESGTVHLSYRVTTTDWDGRTLNSSVSMYRDYENLHFFSDQADIYQDEEEMYMVLKMQQVVMAGNAPKEVNKNAYTDEFLKVRKDFLKSSEVLYCSCSEEGVCELELKATKDLQGAVAIESMKYRYDKKAGKVLETTIRYNSSYKVREIVINYQTIDLDSDYAFKKASKYIFARKGVPKSKYKEYEYIDKRDIQ